MNQARNFQQKLGQIQEELAKKTVTSSVGGGMVTAVANGRYELLEIRIEKELIDPTDPAMLQDMIRAAVNDVMQKAGDIAKSEMGRLTGGLNIPGLF